MTRRASWTRRALKDLRSVDATTADRLLRAVDHYAETMLGDVVRLQGTSTPEYRLRVGDWRVRFELNTPDLVRVLRVLHRSVAYRD